MQISALKENFNNENRVALTPDAVKLFQRLGLEVLIEDIAGINSGCSIFSSKFSWLQKCYRCS